MISTEELERLTGLRLRSTKIEYMSAGGPGPDRGIPVAAPYLVGEVRL